jgi:polysaccharide export outer membrane protein
MGSRKDATRDVIVITLMPEGRELPFTGKIQGSGTVTLLSNKVFVAAGKTAREFEKEVASHYGPKLFTPVTHPAHPAPIEVDGEVKAPGRQPFTGPTTVLKAIQSAGGFTERANKRRVRLVRADGRACMVNCVKAREVPRQDLEVYPGVRVLVAVGPLR